jgi:hypothetical protein
MHISLIVFQGIIATVLMTLWVNAIAWISRQPLYVITILGTMLTGQAGKEKKLSDTFASLFIGTIVHFGVGISFAALFEWLVHSGHLIPGLLQVFLFGVVIGAVAVIVWSAFLRWHPNPPYLPISLYLPVIFVGHIIFAFGAYILH